MFWANPLIEFLLRLPFLSAVVLRDNQFSRKKGAGALRSNHIVRARASQARTRVAIDLLRKIAGCKTAALDNMVPMH
jgi:hypothetical protein